MISMKRVMAEARFNKSHEISGGVLSKFDMRRRAATGIIIFNNAAATTDTTSCHDNRVTTLKSAGGGHHADPLQRCGY